VRTFGAPPGTPAYIAPEADHHVFSGDFGGFYGFGVSSNIWG